MLDLLIGPAGAGKTTTMNELRRAWESQHGAGSVVGLAPSATAAQALAAELGIPTENTAKWWQNYRDHGSGFTTGQLVIVDEASLAGTLSLDRLAGIASSSRAKVLLVGDWAQLQSVDAGGAFPMLVAWWRSSMITSTTSGPSAAGLVCGARERGSRAASPSRRHRAMSLETQPLETP